MHYAHLIDKIYYFINNKSLIMKNTKLNMIHGEKHTNGFKYLQTLDLSYQQSESNKSF